MLWSDPPASALPSCCVIVLSAYVSPEMEAEARSLGAAAVLRKPQSLPDLAHLALTVLEGRRTSGVKE